MVGKRDPSTLKSTIRKGRSLLKLAVQGRARRRYDRGVATFLEWVLRRGPGADVKEFRDLTFKIERGDYLTSDDISALDRVLSVFFDLTYFADPLDTPDHPLFGRWECSEVFCGITDHIPEAKGRLPRSTRCLVAWSRESVPVRASPAPVVLVMGILGFAINKKFYRFAIGIIFMFFGLLRPGEWFGVRFKHVSIDNVTVVSLDNTKTTRNKQNALEYAQIRDIGAIALLRHLCVLANLQQDDLVWDGSSAYFRQCMDMALIALEIPPTSFRLYSLRRGGASHLIDHISMEALLLRGRWQSAKTARVYIESARAEVVRSAFSDVTKGLLKMFSAKLKTLF